VTLTGFTLISPFSKKLFFSFHRNTITASLKNLSSSLSLILQVNMPHRQHQRGRWRQESSVDTEETSILNSQKLSTIPKFSDRRSMAYVHIIYYIDSTFRCNYISFNLQIEPCSFGNNLSSIVVISNYLVMISPKRRSFSCLVASMCPRLSRWRCEIRYSTVRAL